MGPGDEAGWGGGDVFRMGKGMIAPRVIYQIDPEFSEEARKAKGLPPRVVREANTA